MKIVKFLGGLGNQMFQYSFYMALSKHFKDVYADLSEFDNYNLHNGFELEKIFNIKLKSSSSFKNTLYNPRNRKWIWRKLRRIFNCKNIYREEITEFTFDKKVFEDKYNRYYWGYWQHIDYLNISTKELQKDFTFPAIVDQKNNYLLQKIKDNTTISIHVRRGDYLKDPLLGEICDIAYYESAIEYINTKIQSPLFIVFSDDTKWCRKVFQDLNATYVDWNIKEDSFRDMQLMSLCDHNIIANSTFSWWGAWLNKNPEKIVISPKKWINSTKTDLQIDGLVLDYFIKL